MKKTTFISIIIINLFIYSNKIYCQELIDLIPCNSSCIWSAGDNQILEWNINSEMNNPYVVQLDYTCQSLAIGHAQLNADTVYNTFICTEYSGSGITTYWNGDDWNELDVPGLTFVTGIGGFENHLYFQSNTLQGKKNHYYDGTNFSRIDNNSVSDITDIAVDEMGRAWYITKNEDGFFDNLVVINTNGEKLNSYPIDQEIDAASAVGLTIVDDTFYLMLNEANISFPKSIITITIENEIGKIGDKKLDLSQYPNSIFDIASNSPGNPLNVISSNSEIIKNDQIVVFPNPTDNFLNIIDHSLINKEIYIYNMGGNLMSKNKIDKIPYKLNIENFRTGMYILQSGKTSIQFSKI